MTEPILAGILTIVLANLILSGIKAKNNSKYLTKEFFDLWRVEQEKYIQMILNRLEKLEHRLEEIISKCQISSK